MTKTILIDLKGVKLRFKGERPLHLREERLHPLPSWLRGRLRPLPDPRLQPSVRPPPGELQRAQHLHLRARVVRPRLLQVRLPPRVRQRDLREAVRVQVQRGVDRALLRQA